MVLDLIIFLNQTPTQAFIQIVDILLQILTKLAQLHLSYGEKPKVFLHRLLLEQHRYTITVIYKRCLMQTLKHLQLD